MLEFISTLFGKLSRKDESGQTLVEYGLLLALIAIVVIAALILIGPVISQIFMNINANLS